MLVMAKKPKSRMGRPPKPPGRKAIYAKINGDVFDALQHFTDYFNLSNPYTERNNHIEIALREYLASKGFWPPKPAPQDA